MRWRYIHKPQLQQQQQQWIMIHVSSKDTQDIPLQQWSWRGGSALPSECCNWCKKLAWVPTGMDSFFTIKRKSLECIPKSHPEFSAQERSIFFQVASTAKRKLQKISKRHSERERERERERDLNNKSHELQNFNRETKSTWQGRRKKKSPAQKSSSENTKDAGWPHFVEERRGLTTNKSAEYFLHT